MSPSPSSSPPSSTSSCYSTSIPSRRTSSSSSASSSWFHVIFFTSLLYILLFSASCCEAVPVWKSQARNAGSGGSGASSISAGSQDGLAYRLPAPVSDSDATDSADSILRKCLSGERAEESVFIKTLCSLALVRSMDGSRTNSHEGFVKRASDRTAFSAFNRFVHTLIQHANEVSDYQERLNRMQELGFLDNDYNVISVPHETKHRMQQLG